MKGGVVRITYHPPRPLTVEHAESYRVELWTKDVGRLVEIFYEPIGIRERFSAALVPGDIYSAISMERAREVGEAALRLGRRLTKSEALEILRPDLLAHALLVHA